MKYSRRTSLGTTGYTINELGKLRVSKNPSLLLLTRYHQK